MGLIGLIRAYYGSLLGILSGLTKSTDHPTLAPQGPTSYELRSPRVTAWISTPEGPSTQYLRILVPNTIRSMVFGARDLKYWLPGPSGNIFSPYSMNVNPLI